MTHTLANSLTDTQRTSTCNYHSSSYHARDLTTLIKHTDMRMSVAINAVEGYDGAERGCMLLANDCNGHYLPAEWTMNATSHLTSLQTHSTESRNWSDTFSQHLLALALHTLHFLCLSHTSRKKQKTPHIHLNLTGLRCEAAVLLRGPNSSLTRSR